MSWGNELWDQFENLSLHTQKGIDFCEKFSHFLKERCAIENDYAGKLKKLAKSYLPKKKEDDVFSSSKGFEAMVKELNDLAGQHEEIAESLQSSICKDLLTYIQELKQERKKLLQEASKQESALQTQLSQLDKAKKSYERSFKDAEKAQEVYKKSEQDTNLSRAEVDKMKQVSVSRQSASESSKTDYASEVEKTRVFQIEHYQNTIPTIFQQLQEMDEKRIVKVQECIKNSANVEKTVLPIMTKCVDGMFEASTLVNCKKDTQMVIEKFKTGFSPCLDVPFDDLSNPGQSTNTSATGKQTMSGRVKKRTGLLGIFGGQKAEEPKDDFSHLPPNQQKKQLMMKIDSIKASIAKETSERDGLIKMQDVYSSKPNFGNANSLVKQLEENGRKLDSLRGELLKYEAYLSDSDNPPSHETSSGHTPNASPMNSRKDTKQSSCNEQRNSTNANLRESVVIPPPPPLSHQESADAESDDEFTDGGTCTALYAYDGSGDGALNMNAGQHFSIVEQDQGDGWTQVRAPDGSIGFVPTSYVKYND